MKRRLNTSVGIDTPTKNIGGFVAGGSLNLLPTDEVKSFHTLYFILETLREWVDTADSTIRKPIETSATSQFDRILQINDQRPRYGLLHVY
jgi:hypothetical protein